MTNEILGWIGTALLSSSSVPQVIKAFKEGHAKGLSWLYLILTLFGLGSMYFYASLNKAGMVLEISYSVQFVLFSIITARKIFPSKNI
jgi:uncharacterized protein with PQ loop repeat